jgi:hypothetical protein
MLSISNKFVIPSEQSEVEGPAVSVAGSRQPADGNTPEHFLTQETREPTLTEV